MLSVSICRLKGSVGEFSRCRRMMERSIMVPEGSLTGSVIRVSIRGSVETAEQITPAVEANTEEASERQQPLGSLHVGEVAHNESMHLAFCHCCWEEKTAKMDSQAAGPWDRTLCLRTQTPPFTKVETFKVFMVIW